MRDTMTVGQLINELYKLNEDKEIFIYNAGTLYNIKDIDTSLTDRYDINLIDEV